MAFYRDELEMPLTGGWDRPDGKGALLQASENGVIEIYGAATGEEYNGPSPEAINLALRVADVEAVDAWFSRLSARGARLAGQPQDRPWGHRSFVVYDPDGIPVHIYCER